MTTILYVKNDGLYTDSKHIQTYLPKRKRPIYRNKIYKDYKNEFAFAVTGHLVAEGNNKELHEYIRRLIHENKDKLVAPFKPNDYFIRGDSEIIIITATDVYFFNKEAYVNVSELDYFAIGAGMGYAEGVMRLTGDPDYAIRMALRFDQLSGGDINTVKHHELSKMEA